MTQTNQTTQAIINFLNYSAFKVWRNNNVAVYSVKQQSFRKNPSALLGVPDIIGFHKLTGRFICIEIKSGKDKLSEHQKLFLSDAKKSGAISIVAKTFDDFKLQYDVITTQITNDTF